MGARSRAQCAQMEERRVALKEALVKCGAVQV